MIVSIKGSDGDGDCNFSKIFPLGEFEKIVLRANAGYWMKIYKTSGENVNWITSGEKLEKEIKDYVDVEEIDSIAILELKHKSEEKSLNTELQKEGAKRLIGEIYFKPQNRTPSSKIARWPIRIYNPNGFEVRRIPIIVKPIRWHFALFVFYCYGLVILSDLYSHFSSFLAEEQILPSAWDEYLMHLGVKSLVILVGISLAIWIYEQMRIQSERKSYN